MSVYCQLKTFLPKKSIKNRLKLKKNLLNCLPGLQVCRLVGGGVGDGDEVPDVVGALVHLWAGGVELDEHAHLLWVDGGPEVLGGVAGRELGALGVDLKKWLQDITGLHAYSDTGYIDTEKSSPLTVTLFLIPETNMFGYSTYRIL